MSLKTEPVRSRNSLNPGDDMRTRLAAALSAFALTTGLLLRAPAASAHTSDYPDSEFDVTFGNTYTKGTLT
ncbi:hypothetical protein [Streptomyces sp. NPDC058620]|uniref:hypothetical protein n=1 Tax=Streptomyces sp. NPDC058620 TaxID=3346560 RepID=UPI00365010AB